MDPIDARKGGTYNTDGRSLITPSQASPWSQFPRLREALAEVGRGAKQEAFGIAQRGRELLDPSATTDGGLPVGIEDNRPIDVGHLNLGSFRVTGAVLTAAGKPGKVGDGRNV